MRNILAGSHFFKLSICSVLIVALLSIMIVAVEESQETDAEIITVDNFQIMYPDKTHDPVSVLRYTGPGGSVSVPNTLGGYHVSIIQQSVFYDRKDITEIKFEEGIDQIVTGAIYMCPNLSKVTIPKSAEITGQISSFPTFTFYDENQHKLNYNQLGGYSYVRQNVHGDNCMVRVLNTYTASFNVDGESASVPSISVKEKNPIILPSYSGEKTGCEFKGWTYDGKTYSPGDSFTMPSKNVTFKAKWSNDSSFNMLAIVALVSIGLIVAVVWHFKKR